MKYNQIIVYFLAIMMLLVSASCERGFEELNVDPDDPTETSANFLFNGLLASLPYVRNEKLYLNNHHMYQWSQLSASLFDEPNEVSELGRDPVWDDHFGAVRNVRELEKRLDAYTGDPARMQNRRALLKIVYAYKTLRTTDLYGDMPYSEAGRGVDPENQIFRPQYDTQEAIYRDALAELKWAADNLVTDAGATTPAGETYFNYGPNETLFNNDMLKWKKLANALRLRYALRMSNVDEAYARETAAEILNGNQPLPEGHEDMFAFSPARNGVSADIYWAYEFFAGIRMGENIWNHMTEDTNPDGSGIIDPRVYIYFEPNDSGLWVPAPQSPADRAAGDQYGHPYVTERQNDPTGFENRGYYSGFNFFLVNDKNNATEFHVAYPEVCFLRAECYQRGFASGNAQEWYEKGIRASIEKWYMYGTTHIDYVDPPAMPTDEEITAFINHPEIAFDASKGLMQIHVQRWIDLLLQPQEAFHLVRRSGLIPQLEVVNAVNGQTESMPLRLKYPIDEYNHNSENVKEQANEIGGDELTTPVWWDSK